MGDAWETHEGGFEVALGSQSVAYRLPTKCLWGGYEMALGGFAQALAPISTFYFLLSTFARVWLWCGFGWLWQG